MHKGASVVILQPARRLLVAIFVILTAITIYACGDDTLAPTASTPPGPGSGSESNTKPTDTFVASGDVVVLLTITLATQPSPARVGPVVIEVEVQDSNRRPVEGATVSLTTSMSGMSHGGAKGQLAEIGAGKYQGRGSFGMIGLWKLEVEVGFKKGATPVTRSFEIGVDR